MTDAFDGLIADAAKRHALPFPLVKAVVQAESGFDPGAVRQEPQIRDFSAGLMQILLGTARSEGYTGTSGDPSDLSGLFDPATNLEYGCKWLQHCFIVAGSYAGAVSMYNGGWRPRLGFGRPVDHDITICLAHDQHTGDCIKTHLVKAGEYGNQAYVDKVLSAMSKFAKVAA